MAVSTLTDIALALAHAEAVGYNQGVADAIAALKARGGCGECDFSRLYAEAIQKLDKSLQAIDD